MYSLTRNIVVLLLAASNATTKCMSCCLCLIRARLWLEAGEQLLSRKLPVQLKLSRNSRSAASPAIKAMLVCQDIRKVEPQVDTPVDMPAISAGDTV